MGAHNVLLEKVPPQNLEAEMSVIGSMLTDEWAIARAIELLRVENFYKEAHQIIFAAVIDLFERNEAVDLITITERLRCEEKLERVGGASYIALLIDSVPTTTNIDHYARIVKEKATLRVLIETAGNIIDQCYEQQEEIDVFLDKIEQSIFNIAQNKVQSDFFELKELIHDSLEMAEMLSQKKQLVTGTPTSFTKFDEMTSGLQSSDLIIIAGRPSMGKSSFAINIAEHVGISERVPLAFFSLEMSKEQLVQRMLCSQARVDAHKLRTGYLSDSAFPRLATAAGRLSEATIFIDDTPAISVLELRAKARRLKLKENIGLIVIDYLQLIQGRSRIENRQQEISEISRSLKALARELKIPVIALSQLSRAVESREDHRPKLSDLRESGAIEQDADVVALLLREEYYQPTEENRGIAEVNIAKQRNGPVGIFKLAFVKESTRFENLSLRTE